MIFRLNKGSPGDPFSLGLYPRLFFALFVVASYLQPFHSTPWTGAVSNGLFVFAGFLVILAAWRTHGGPTLSLSRADWLTGLALTAHSAWFAFTTTNRGIAPYVLVLAVTFLCYKLTRNRKDILLTLLAGVAVSAVLTAFLSGGQWLGVWDSFPGRFLWIADALPGTALSGNLSQPNNTGSLLVWGLISIVTLEAHVNGQAMPRYLAQPLAALVTTSVLFVAVAAALTQSRTTSLEILLLTALIYCYRQQCGQRVMGLIWLGFCAHWVTVLFLPEIKDLLFDIPSAGLFNGKTMMDGARVYAYETFFKAILQQPFLGYGIGGITSAFLASAPLDRGLGVYFGHTHNLVLDLLVCFGVPLGAWITYQLARFFVLALPKVNSMAEIAALAMISTLLIHAMLELPQHYAYFLIPLGILCAQLPQPVSVRPYKVTKGWLVVSTAGLAALFALLSIEYLRLEQDIRSGRLQLAVTGRASPPSDERAYLLPELKRADVMIRTPVVAGMTAAQLDLFEATTQQLPMRPFIEKYSMALEVNGRTEDAKRWRTLGCAIYRIKPCPDTAVSAPIQY
jgi:hypothetical protein